MSTFRITTQTTYLVEAESLGRAVATVEALNSKKPTIETYNNEHHAEFATVESVDVVGAQQKVSHG